jgi:fumarate reductase flavoprotein subunit
MDFTHWRVNARLVSTFINKSASTIDWLEKMGVEFIAIMSHGLGNNPTQHTVKGPDSGPGTGPGQVGPASAMMQILAERAKELGVKIYLKTPVQKILKEGDRTAGVVARDESGKEIEAKARAVIIATGGYGAGALPGGHGGVGDGIRMAREAGADTIETPQERGGGGPPPFAGRFYTVAFTFQQPSLMVNLDGERFMNEEAVLSGVFARNAIASQKDGTAFTIFDEDTKRVYMETGLDVLSGGVQLPIVKTTDFDDELKQVLERGSDSIFVTDSIEELAEKTGIDRNGLRATLDEYNQACETGRDEIFHKRARYLRPVKRPKFYASKNVGETIRGWNGIRINYKTEVLTRERRAIPGLYAAGMDAACNIYYDTYPFVLPATAMGFAINSGRMAAENALKYIGK